MLTLYRLNGHERAFDTNVGIKVSMLMKTFAENHFQRQTNMMQPVLKCVLNHRIHLQYLEGKNNTVKYLPIRGTFNQSFR